MKKFVTALGAASLSALSLLFSSASAEAANLTLRSDLLTEFSKFVPSEGIPLDEQTLPKLDSSQLFWEQGVSDVEVYFINEAARFKNQLFFSANDGPMNEIFNNISSTQSIVSEDSGVLTLGEGRTLGSFDGPTQLSFFLKADGFNGGQKVYGADEYTGSIVDGQEINRDGLSHLIAYSYFDEIEQQEYTILGFEDLRGPFGQGSDRDFNDAVFAIRGIVADAETTEATSEPSTLLSLVSLLGLTAIAKQRSLKKSLNA